MNGGHIFGLSFDVVVKGVAHPLRSLAHCSDPDGPAEEFEALSFLLLAKLKMFFIENALICVHDTLLVSVWVHTG